MSRTNHHGKQSPRWRFKMPNAYGQSPKAWVNAFMTRPRRRRDARQLQRVAAGKVDADDATYSVGGRKPHICYW